MIVIIGILSIMLICGCVKHPYDASKDLSKIAESDMAYLLDDEFILSSDNFTTYFHDYLSAPAMLYFDYENNHYRCENSPVAAAFANVITDAVFIEITYDEFSEIAYSYNQYNDMKTTYPSLGFTNIIHSISFVFDSERTYIACFRNMTSPTCFMIEDDLYSDFITVTNMAISVSDAITNPDELTQFE